MRELGETGRRCRASAARRRATPRDAARRPACRVLLVLTIHSCGWPPEGPIAASCLSRIHRVFASLQSERPLLRVASEPIFERHPSLRGRRAGSQRRDDHPGVERRQRRIDGRRRVADRVRKPAQPAGRVENAGCRHADHADDRSDSAEQQQCDRFGQLAEPDDRAESVIRRTARTRFGTTGAGSAGTHAGDAACKRRTRRIRRGGGVLGPRASHRGRRRRGGAQNAMLGVRRS